MTKILVVDDEKHIVDLISFNLAAMGHEVLTASDGHTAIEKVRIEEPDLILLDVMLPKMDGLQVCQFIRTSLKRQTPIIMVSGKTDVVDKVLGLEMGANDYVTKPFSPKELNARVKANLRQQGSPQHECASADHIDNNSDIAVGIVFNNQDRTAMLNETILDLTPKEYDLLKVLAKNKGKALRREYLINYVWGGDYQGDLRTLDVHIRYLRQKLSNSMGYEIITVRGYGYRLEIS